MVNHADSPNILGDGSATDFGRFVGPLGGGGLQIAGRRQPAGSTIFRECPRRLSPNKVQDASLVFERCQFPFPNVV